MSDRTKEERLDMIKVADQQRAYIAQLRSSIGDLLTAGKARGWLWRNIWNSRVDAAQSLLRKRDLW